MKKPKVYTVQLSRRRGGATETFSLPDIASESAEIYVELIVSACAKLKISPRDALLNTEDYPQLHKVLTLEFAIGWLHGCAEAYDLLPEQLFDAILPPPVLQSDIDKLKRTWSIPGKRRPAQKITPRKRAA